MRIDLGNIAILTEVARQVTPETTNGKDGTARIKMVQRFFLNGIGGDGRKYTVALGDEFTFSINPCVAFTILARVQDALVRTKLALN